MDLLKRKLNEEMQKEIEIKLSEAIQEISIYSSLTQFTGFNRPSFRLSKDFDKDGMYSFKGEGNLFKQPPCTENGKKPEGEITNYELNGEAFIQNNDSGVAITILKLKRKMIFTSQEETIFSKELDNNL